jgi:hypothetical protein
MFQTSSVRCRQALCELTDFTVSSQQQRREFAMEILVAILAIVGVGLGYRYWRARTAH